MLNSDRLLVLKLGGSVITDKRKAFTPRVSIIKAISRQLSKIKEPMLIVRGAGSFGHIPVKKFDLHRGFHEEQQLRGCSETKLRLLELDAILLQNLIRHGVPAVTYTPSSMLIAGDGRIEEFNLEPMESLLSLGFVPLIGGDIVPDRKTGFSVVSGDQIAAYLAVRLKARILLLGSDVDGVFTSDPKKDRSAKLIGSLSIQELNARLSTIGTSSAPDVTGGMLGKLMETIQVLRAGIEVVIFNLNKPERIEPIIKGDSVLCTRIHPS